MIKIVFPTNEKFSYISSVEASFEYSDYLTVLNVEGQHITDVETIDNPYIQSTESMLKSCKENNFRVLISPQGDCLPLEELHENGVHVFKTDDHKNVLHTFSDFVQDKLKRID